MNRTLALLAGTIGALAVLVIANVASAQTLPGPQRVYPPPPSRGAELRETPTYAPDAPPTRYLTPTYAPDAPPPRNFYNNGIPDHQLDAR